MPYGKSLVVAALVASLILTGLGGPTAAAGPAACKRVSYVVRVNFNDDKHHNIIDHAFDARRDGHPRTLHIAREEADANRKASLRGVPTKRFFFER